MNRTLTVLFLALVAVVSGCADTETQELQELRVDAENVDTNMTGPEILNSSIETVSTTSSHMADSSSQFVLDASVFSLSLDMSTEAAANYTERTAASNTTGNLTAGASFLGTNTTDFRARSYLQNETLHVKRANESEDGEWSSSNHSFEDHPATLNTETFEGAEAELIGQQTVNGNQTYVLKLRNHTDKLGQHFSNTLQAYGPGLSQANTTEQETVNQENLEKTQTYIWIDQKTWRPAKYSYFLSIKAEGSNQGLIQADGTFQFKSQNTYSGYNQGQEIERPEEIKE